MDARNEPIDRIADACARVIFDGGTILFPSDTGYCIGCDPMRPDTLQRIHEMFGDQDPELALYLPSASEFLEHARANPIAILAARRLLPAPVAWIVSGSPLPLRVPDEPVARAILERVGPVAAARVPVSTSVAPDLVVQNGPARYDREASVVDLTQHPVRLLREGAIDMERLGALLGPIQRQIAKVRSQS